MFLDGLLWAEIFRYFLHFKTLNHFDYYNLLYSFSGWLEPLLDRIARNSTTVVCPVIDVIDDSSMEYHFRDAGGVNVGGFDWNLQFNWHAVPDREKKRHKVSFLYN